MSAPDSSVSSVWMPNLAMLIFVTLGLFSQKTPLQSQRPAAAAGESPTLSSENRARLWEDPLRVAAPPAATPPSTDTAAGVIDQVVQRTLREKQIGWMQRKGASATVPPARLLVLPVLLPGAPYAEAAETRLRMRYAVLSALGRAQYVPDDAGYLKFATAKTATGPEHRLRFEEFTVRYLVADDVHLEKHENDWNAPSPRTAAKLQAARPYDRVVVLWLDENSLTRPPAPLAIRPPVLARQLDDLLRAHWKKPDPKVADRVEVDIRVIGPSDSDTLCRLVEPLDDADRFEPRHEHVSFYSPRATLADHALGIAASREEGATAQPFDRIAGLKSHVWPLHRTIATDDQLVRALLHELRQRDATPDAGKHLVLIGEWDSLYARALGRTFAVELLARDSGYGHPPRDGAHAVDRETFLRDRANWSATPAYLHEFSYLRGLDGSVAPPPPAPAKPTSSVARWLGLAAGSAPVASAPSSPATAATDRHERAEGPAQTDYLRRLESRLLELQQQLGDAGSGKAGAEIRAIGIIGSDTYDKLLVLRALRTSFPRAIIFTTDLDAGYLDPQERAHTRNLLVVAPFGLVLHPDLQHRIPPFRDSYQTALFATVLRAVLDHPVHCHPTLEPLTLRPAEIAPRVYEIGQTRLTDLSPRTEGLAARLQPPRPISVVAPLFGAPVWARLVLLFPLLVWWLLWAWWGRSAWHPEPQTARWRVQTGSLRFSLHLAFGATWMASTVGWVTVASHPYGPIWIKWVLLLLSLPYGWLFYRLGTEIAAPAPFRPLRARDPWRLGAAGLYALFCLGGAVALGIVLYRIKHRSGEEAFAWFEGTSIWPTELIRVAAVCLTIYFVVRTQARIGRLEQRLTRAFRLWDLRTLPRQDRPRRETHWFRSLWPRWTRFDAPGDERLIWAEYRRAAAFPRRFLRVIVLMSTYVAFFCGVMVVSSFPVVPARGPWSLALDRGLLVASVLSHCYLLFYVCDAMVLVAALARRLAACIGRATYLPDGSAIHLLNELTDQVAKLVYLPFTILFMLIAARNTIFDAWDWPPGLLGVFGSGLLLLIAASATLSLRADAARRRALEQLNAEVLQLTAHDARKLAPAELTAETAKAEVTRRLEHAREQRNQVNAFDGVVFKAWHQNPVYRAMLIPIGGLSSISLIEHLGAMS